MNVLDKAWQTWIAQKHQAQCPHDEIYAEMLQTGLDETTALFNLVVFSQVSDALAAASPSEGFVQEKSVLSHLPNSFETRDGQHVTLRMRIDKPDIVLLDDFLTDDECDALREAAKPSLVTTDVGLKYSPHASDERLDKFTTLPRSSSLKISAIENRIAEITGIACEQGEDIQVVKYGLEANYHPHYDYLPDENQDAIENPRIKGGRRIMTLLMYLTDDVTQGGATVFPHLNLSFYPKKRSVLFFSYANSLGQYDPSTLHAGTFAATGEKWIATKWIRERLF